MGNSIFGNYDNSGEVQKNSHPNTGIYPWIPNKLVSQSGVGRLVTTNERKSWFVNNDGINPTAKTSRSGCACGGCGDDTTK